MFRVLGALMGSAESGARRSRYVLALMFEKERQRVRGFGDIIPRVV